MKELLQKIKNKLFPKPDFDLEDDEDLQNENQEKEEEIEDVEVDLSAPEVASSKKNKMAIILASSVLITFVIYFLFFKGGNQPQQNLESVRPVIINPAKVAGSEDGKSPFEFDENSRKSKDELTSLDKPKTPEIPKLPEISSDNKDSILALPQDLFMDVPKKEEKIETASGQENQAFPQIAMPTTPSQQAAVNQQPKISDPRYAPIIVLQGAAGPANAVGYEDNIRVLKPDPIDALEKSQIGVKTSFIDDRSSVVAQGKFLSAVLETAINTETQGSVRAIVSRDVYGEAGSKVLIPRGSRLYGAYSTDTARGRSRVQINWTRLIRPDGVSLSISSFASDQFGRAGIEGVVDNKYGQIVVNSILTSVLAVAGAALVDAAVGNNQQTTTVNPATGSATMTSNATLQAAVDVSSRITDAASRFANEYFDARPVITIPQGTRITVLVNSDIKMPPIK